MSYKNKTDDKHPEKKHWFFKETQSFKKLSSVFAFKHLAVPNSDTPVFWLKSYKNQTDDKHPEKNIDFFQENQSFEKLSSVFAFKNLAVPNSDTPVFWLKQ